LVVAVCSLGYPGLIPAQCAALLGLWAQMQTHNK
jgi:hypothetical protein